MDFQITRRIEFMTIINSVKSIFEYILSHINSEYIALFSVLVTIIIFVLNRRSELKYKKYEDKKIEYMKLISLLNITYTDPDKMKLDKNGKPNRDMQKQFFDTGASLMLYASKKLYKEYVFFRDFSSSEHMKLSKYYDPDMIMYIIARLMKQIRKEVGLSNLNSISLNESLAFFINDFGMNPIQKNKSFQLNYKIRMLKIELFFMNVFHGVFAKYIFYALIKPIFGIIRCIFIYLIILPPTHLIRALLKKNKSEIESD